MVKHTNILLKNSHNTASTAQHEETKIIQKEITTSVNLVKHNQYFA